MISRPGGGPRRRGPFVERRRDPSEESESDRVEREVREGFERRKFDREKKRKEPRVGWIRIGVLVAAIVLLARWGYQRLPASTEIVVCDLSAIALELGVPVSDERAPEILDMSLAATSEIFGARGAWKLALERVAPQLEIDGTRCIAESIDLGTQRDRDLIENAVELVPELVRLECRSILRRGDAPAVRATDLQNSGQLSRWIGQEMRFLVDPTARTVTCTSKDGATEYGVLTEIDRAIQVREIGSRLRVAATERGDAFVAEGLVHVVLIGEGVLVGLDESVLWIVADEYASAL